MLVFETLRRDHDRGRFDCGAAELNSYLRTLASQDIRRRLSTCVVLTERGSAKILGFYAMSAGAYCLEGHAGHSLSAAYGVVPFATLGRLAVDKSCQGMGLGSQLVIHAIRLAHDSKIPFAGVATDPLNKDLVPFYEKYGFRRVE